MVEKIKPRGKTPIAATIEKTVQNLQLAIKKQESVQDRAHHDTQANDEKTTIVLISDGIETCGGDPCAVVAALKSFGMKFVMHVVGFDVDRNASEQLGCIAKAAGGRYFGAPNPGELLSILLFVQKNVAEKSSSELRPSDESPLTDSIAKVELSDLQKLSATSKSASIKAKGPGKITFRHDSWLRKPYAWKLIDPETGEERGNFSTLETTMVTPGDYQLVWDQYEHESSDVSLTEVIKVESGKSVEIPLMTAIQLNIPSWVAKPEYWGLRDPQTLETVVTFINFEPFLVPAGEYDLIWRQGEHSAYEVAIQKVNIIADRVNQVTLATAINPIPADWVQKKIHYWGLKPVERAGREQSIANQEELITNSLTRDEKKLGSDPEKFIAWFSDSFSPQFVPPGRYKFFYDISEHGSSESFLGEVEVAEGKMNDFQINT